MKLATRPHYPTGYDIDTLRLSFAVAVVEMFPEVNGWDQRQMVELWTMLWTGHCVLVQGDLPAVLDYIAEGFPIGGLASC